MSEMKEVRFWGNALDVLREFPKTARREAGYQIDQVQRGLDPDDWKMMTTIGPGVREIRIRDEAGAFRVIFIARLADTLHILHCFQKRAVKPIIETLTWLDKDIEI